MKTTVIHHSADYDGIFCREIARKFLPDAKLIGWDFADAPLTSFPDGNVVVMDLPVDRPYGFDFNKPETILSVFGDVDGMKDANSRLVWIDHHKSSIESHPKEIPGYRIDGVAACRLAWQWFTHNIANKEDFIERKVSEPIAVRLAGEYDIWDKRHEWTDKFQFGLRLKEPKWDMLLQSNPSVESDAEVLDMVNSGEIAQGYQQKIDAGLVTYKSFRLKWEGLDFLCLNTGRFNSLTFAALDKPETGHDALLGFMWNGKVWTVSLYHANHRKDIDLSLIAVKHGGGGHKGACGFTAKTLPFIP